jgi:hypothetical protein
MDKISALLLTGGSTVSAATATLRCGGLLEIVGGVPLSLSGTHGCFAEHRTRLLLSVTLYVCSGGIHISSAVILTRLRCAARDNDQNDELTQLCIGHPNLQDLRCS